jgi:hypothetical protein
MPWPEPQVGKIGEFQAAIADLLNQGRAQENLAEVGPYRFFASWVDGPSYQL